LINLISVFCVYTKLETVSLDELKEELLEWEEFPYEQQKALDKLICTLDKINETLQ